MRGLVDGVVIYSMAFEKSDFLVVQTAIIPFLSFSCSTSVSDMGETKPTGRGLWGWLDMVCFLGHGCFVYVSRNCSGITTLQVVIIIFMSSSVLTSSAVIVRMSSDD
jgi:hypothetical protein